MVLHRLAAIASGIDGLVQLIHINGDNLNVYSDET